MPLFNPKILQSCIQSVDAVQSQTSRDAAADWAKRVADPGIDLQNESQLEQEFNRIIVQEVLGYAAPAPGAPGTMRVKQPVPGGTTVDLALGHFLDSEALILAPFELKGPKVSLDRIMPGRQKTPVQQAWDYAMDAPGARWVLLTNMKELRLYAVGYGRQDYELFDLKRLGDPEELARLQLLLHADLLLTGATSNLLARSSLADRDVTNQLYHDYKTLREELLNFVCAHHAHISVEDRIRIVQTLLDRLLFIAFAEDKFLLPARSLQDAVQTTNRYNPQPKWDQLRTLFRWVDEGAPPHNIPRYNGGLFARDPLIEALNLPDHVVERFALLGNYDFASEVSVNILGHIFEQSITDIENEKSAAGIEAPPPTSKKKREGVVYTPDFITRFIVEETIGRHLQEISDKLLPNFGKTQADGEIRWKNSRTAEADYWSNYLDRLTSLRILDPACGSGAFLIAAFNFLNGEQKRVRDRLSELRPGILAHTEPNADVEIITNNLFGVDVNAESVEITKLALWLQTAKRERALESLDGNIRHGNSLVESGAYHPRPFIWIDEFSEILTDDGGFDIVLGNPPYVRMELVKPIKPHLEARFRVATDRADLYAYFFELGLRLLKPDGRLGFISSSTFFRTGSGKLLRAYLAEHSSIESVIDFGDLPVFEGVTTYPAIITLKKSVSASASESLKYLTVRELPDDLGKTFEQEARSMPRSRLSSGTWRFESDLLDSIRAKMADARRSFTATYGAPLYGIKTGLNKAFILSREQRDALVDRDKKSADLIKPFLMGENLQPWHVEDADLWLIYTPKNRVQIEDYPAVRDHLAPWKAKLEQRATKQNWWELQQAQAAYEDHFQNEMIIWRDISRESTASWMSPPRYLDCTCFFAPSVPKHVLGFLGSSCFWFQVSGLTPIARGGFLRLKSQYYDKVWPCETEALEDLVEDLSRVSSERAAVIASVHRRLGDLSRNATHIAAFAKWPELTFAELRASLKKRTGSDIPVGERDEWEAWLASQKSLVSTLTTRIKDAGGEINSRVYRQFSLTAVEIAAIEDSLALVSPSLNMDAYEAISAVEGLELTEEGRNRISGPGTASEKRTSILKAHARA